LGVVERAGGPLGLRATLSYPSFAVVDAIPYERGNLTDAPPAGLFDRPTSVFLGGDSRPLLNWVAYALTVGNPGGFVWTDIQLVGEVRDEADLLRTNRVPSDRFFEVPPNSLVLDDFAGNVALGGLVRTDESPETTARLADFLRLPSHAQTLLSRLTGEGPPAVLVLSNSHRIAALYSWETAGPAVRSIVQSGASLLVTWAEAPTKSRLEFEHVLLLKGNEPASWRDAILRVERGASSGPLRTGAELRLAEYPEVAGVLGRIL
jgi:hypothetical protein